MQLLKLIWCGVPSPGEGMSWTVFDSTCQPPPPGTLQAFVMQLLQLLVASLSWLACSSGIIILNRYIMRELNFCYPMVRCCG